MTLEKLFKLGQNAAEDIFKVSGAIHPMWICETEDGHVVPICVEMPERKHRDKVAEVLKEQFKLKKVVRYVMLVECWMKEMDPPKDGKKPTHYAGSLADDPDRREGVFIAAEDVNGETRSGSFFILRPEHKKATLSPFKETTANQPEGRFAKLLNPED